MLWFSMSRKFKLIIFYSTIISTIAITFLLDPISQNKAYHSFIDQRSLGFIPNYMDVATNLGFLIVGLMGLIGFKQYQDSPGNRSWMAFFIGVSLTSLGSAYYHWNPNNATLVWDRLPMTLSFMGLFCALMSEYIYSKFDRLILIIMISLGIFTVFHWQRTDDLRFYFWIQFMPLLVIPIAMILFKSPFGHGRYLVYGLLAYGLAKVVETNDVAIFKLSGSIISGHSLKHILATLGIYMVYRMLKLRRRVI